MLECCLKEPKETKPPESCVLQAWRAVQGVGGHRTPSPYAMTLPARLAGAAQPERSSSAGFAAIACIVLSEVKQGAKGH